MALCVVFVLMLRRSTSLWDYALSVVFAYFLCILEYEFLHFCGVQVVVAAIS